MAHEDNHAVRHLDDAKKMLEDKFVATTNGTDNSEEERTIAETNKTAKELNNGDGGGRTTHGGTPLFQPCITCHESEKEQEKRNRLIKKIEDARLPQVNHTANKTRPNGNGTRF